MNKILGGVMALVWMTGIVAPACWAEGETRTLQGAGVGALLGAVAGGVIGHQSHHAAGGALIGGAVGAAGGALMGSTMKKSDTAAKPADPNVAVKPAADAVQKAEPSHVTIQQIVYWTKEGLPADEIMARIQASKSAYTLVADDLDYLRKQGVSQRVIELMQGLP